VVASVGKFPTLILPTPSAHLAVAAKNDFTYVRSTAEGEQHGGGDGRDGNVGGRGRGPTWGRAGRARCAMWMLTLCHCHPHFSSWAGTGTWVGEGEGPVGAGRGARASRGEVAQ